MRVGIFIEQYNPARGGRERSTSEIAALLIERGLAVEIVCLSGRSDQPGLTVRTLPAGPGRALRAARFIRAAGAVAGEYDIAHAMLPVPGADLYQIRSGTLPGMRAGYIRQRGPLGRLTWPANSLRGVLTRAERKVVSDRGCWCVPNSQMVAGELAAHFGRGERVRVIFNGVTVPEIDPAQRAAWRAELRGRWGVADDAFVLVLVTMDFGRKGGPELLRAWRQYRQGPGRADDRLVLVGNVPRGCEGVIAMKPTAPIWPIYAAADASAVPSWYDACSRVVLESVATGTPCVTTRYNGAAEALAGGAGVVIDDPAERDALAGAIAELADPAGRTRRVAACAAEAPRLSMSRHVDELLELYREIASQ